MVTAIITICAVGFVFAVGIIGARRAGYSGMGGRTIVRCSKGHLFTTIWVPGASLKAIRFGFARFQYCPVGRHWALVTPVNDADLTEADREAAKQYHDAPLP